MAYDVVLQWRFKVVKHASESNTQITDHVFYNELKRSKSI